MVVASDPVLVGRDEEHAKVVAFLGDLAGGPAAMLLCGGAGIGKTSLWRAALGQAAAAGVAVTRTRCTEIEMPIAFGALADLLAVPAGADGPQLEPAQERALAVALGRAAADGEPVEWLALASAVLACLQARAGAAPLLLAVDDLQWLDPGSRRVLAWALRRLGGFPVGLLATLNAPPSERDPLALADAWPPERLSLIELGPLSSGALQRVIADRLGTHLPRPTLTRVHAASGGNPLFALEFVRTVGTHEGNRLAAPLTVPESLEQVVRARVGAIPRRLRPLLEVVAALERPTLPLLERAAGPAVATLVEEAVLAQTVVVGADGLIRLAHPLYASVIYFGMSPTHRGALHGRLAGVVDSGEERARHAALATAEPDAATAAFVEAAADDACARGALDAAAALADEAARLTPPGDGDARRRRSLAAARWLVETSEFDAARMRLDALVSETLTDDLRTEALLLRAECELGDRRLLVRLLREACDSAPDPHQRWHALIRLAHHEGWVSGDAQLAARLAGEALDAGIQLDEAPLVALASAALGYYEAARGRVATLVEAGKPARSPRMQWWQIDADLSLGVRLMWAGELERARAALRQGFERHVRAGREAHAGFVLCSLAELEWRAGEWDRAELHAREATERLGDVNPTAFPRALVAASRGRVEEAYALTENVLAWAARNDERVAPPRFQWLLGLLELSRGDAGRASAALSEAQGLLDAAGIREPAYLPVLPDLAEALVSLGRLDEADAALHRLSHAAVRHRLIGPAADRARAAVLLGRNDAAAAAEVAAAAAQALTAAGAPFEAARALLVAGSARRRLGERRRAAGLLADAARRFGELGAALWLARAEDELRRSQPRRVRDRDELTAAEVQVAELVAAGRKNREVAAELYTTVATVEAHLTRIYRKLGVRSRTDLARLAAAGETRAGKPAK